MWKYNSLFMTSEQVDELWQRLGDQLDMLVTRTQKLD